MYSVLVMGAVMEDIRQEIVKKRFSIFLSQKQTNIFTYINRSSPIIKQQITSLNMLIILLSNNLRKKYFHPAKLLNEANVYCKMKNVQERILL